MQRRVAARLGIPPALLALAASAWAQAVPTGSIAGTVLSAEGKPLPRAVLVYGPAAPAKAKAIAAMRGPALAARTAADGSFTLAQLAPGNWLICVEAPGHLDPCHWSYAPPVIAVAAGQAARNTVIRLEAACTLHIQVKDPQRLLPNEGKAAAARLLIAARTPSGALHRASLSSNVAGERGYTVTVPARSPARVFVAGGSFQLQDGAAAPVPAAGRLVEVAPPDPAKAMAGGAARLSFTVAGMGRP